MTTYNGEKIKYFIYARKSQENEERQVQSIPDQLEDLNRISSKLNLEIVDIFTEAKSAKDPYMRPKFEEMVSRIKKGEANGILVWHTNRLFRNPIDLGTIQWMLQQGVIQRIQTLDRQFNPSDSVILLSIEGSMANQYIIDLRKACTRGMISRAKKGWYPSMPPAGYLNDRNTNEIIPEPERFQLIRKMWDMMLSGRYKPNQIVDIANAEWGYRTRAQKRQGAKPITPSRLYSIFHNVFYTGMFDWGGVRYKGAHKPMITMTEFVRVQALLGNNTHSKIDKHEFTYNGLIKCGECGYSVTGTKKRKWVKVDSCFRDYTYYRCSRKSRTVMCSQSPIQEADLDRQLITSADKISLPGEFKAHLEELLQKEKSKIGSDFQAGVQMAKNSLKKTEKEISNLSRMRYMEQIDESYYISEKTLLEDKIIDLKYKIENSKDVENEILLRASGLLNICVGLVKNFKNGDVSGRKAIIKAVGSNYTLTDKIIMFDKAKWLCIAENGCPPIKAYFDRLELTKSPYFIRVNGLLLNLLSHLVHYLRQSSNSSKEEYPDITENSAPPP